MTKRLLIVVNSAEFFLSHRLPIALAAQASGYEVHVATADSSHVARIRREGLIHHVLPLSRGGSNPLQELRALVALNRLTRALAPDIMHLVTIKPVLYGGLVSRLNRVPAVVAAISGLGHVFTAAGHGQRIKTWLVGLVYRLALGHPNKCVVFQNPNDRDTLSRFIDLPASRIVIIPGSGVNLEEYACRPEPAGIPVVLLASRLLKTKGINEFAQAARIVHERGREARFLLVGKIDPDNPASLSQADLDRFSREGHVELAGFRTDMAEVLAEANLVVLPSYYGEGLPKILIEAAACGRAVVTTDHPGCRDAVIPGETGLLVPVRDAARLADAIERLLADPELRTRMGRAGRALAEERFDISIVIGCHVHIYRCLLSDGPGGAALIGETRNPMKSPSSPPTNSPRARDNHRV